MRSRLGLPLSGLPFVLGVGLLVPTAPAAGLVPAAAPTVVAASSSGSTPGARTGRQPAPLPRLRVRPEVTGLDTAWDVQVLPDGTRLVSERDRARVSTYAGGVLTPTDFPSEEVWVSGETGLMSLEVDPRFEENRRFYTCSGWETDGGHDVRVHAWELDGATVTFAETLVKGIPTTTGRHGGCRLLIARGGALLVGTGDAAVGTNPRDLRSLGGKTLRVDRFTGRPWPGNPFPRAESRRKRLVLTYGHRNVQGLAQRADGSLWSVEHGPSRDDEVNLLRPGGDHGWHPVPGYDESVPMTDRALPGPQRVARWSSGTPTLATSGAVWVRGAEWGRLAGTLAVAALAGQRVVFMKFDRDGRLRWTRAPRSLRAFGRLRSVTRTPGNALLLTTSNGGGEDRVLRVAPRRR